MSSKHTVLITGANTGIGYETVKALLESPKPYHVIVGVRSIEKGEEALSHLEKDVPSTTNTLELLQIDVASDDSISKAFHVVKDKHGLIDVLVNNAGASFDFMFRPGNNDANDIGKLRQSFNNAYNVNTAGTHVMTHVFAPLLLKSSDPRLLFITSGLSNMHNLEDVGLMPFQPRSVPPAGWPKPNTSPVGYRSSKAALNMVMLTWHWLFKEDGVKVWCVSPGFLATGLGGNKEMLKKMGAGEPSIGANLIKRVIEGERDADVGKVVNQDGIQPW